MADHLSALALDEVSAGLTPAAGAQEHLKECAECVARLEALRVSRAAVLSSPEARRRLEALRSTAAASPAPASIGRRWRLATAVAAPLAAAGLVLALWQPGDERLKGVASLELLSSGGAPVKEARVGQHVTLAVGGAGYRRAAVLAVDGAGRVSRVWPAAGTTTAPIARGARVPLEPGFEVTPGSVTLYAFFSDEPIDLGLLVRGTEANVAQSLRRGEVPSEFTPQEELAPAAARLRLEVQP